MAVGAILGAVLGAAVSAGVGAATRPRQPGAPDYGAATAAGIQEQANLLPLRRQIEAAARLGQHVSVPTGNQVQDTRPYVDIANLHSTAQPGTNNSFNIHHAPQYVPFIESEWQPGGKYYGQTNNGKIPPTVTHPYSRAETYDADFTGKGDADVDALLSHQMNQAQLELEQKYGPAYIEQAQKELQQSDPLGYQARQLLAQKINEQTQRKNYDRPVSTALDAQISDEIAKNGHTTASDDALAKQALASRADVDPALITEMLNTGMEGQKRREMEQQKTLSYLSSGTTPEDVNYRRTQQNLANESAFLAGRTPTAEFGQLSGAQNGPAPFRTPQLPEYNAQEAGAYPGYVAQSYNNQVRNVNSQVNPWLMGISVALRGAGAATAAG